MYYIDTDRQAISRFDFDSKSGKITNEIREHVIVKKENGHPDGMTIDNEGNLWVAHWGGG